MTKIESHWNIDLRLSKHIVDNPPREGYFLPIVDNPINSDALYVEARHDVRF